MKLIPVAIGIIVLVLGGALAISPTILSSISSQAGITSSVVTYNNSMLITVKQNGYADTMISLASEDNLTGTIQSNPAGVEFLLMNQGNFSEFSQGNATSYQIYTPPSSLNVGNYSFSFSTSKGQNYYLVFKAPSTRNISTDVLLRIRVTSQVSAFDTSLIPVLLAILGVIVLAFGIFSGRQRNNSKKASTSQKGAASISASSQTGQASPSIAITKCKYCGSSMRSDTAFCPSCGKSQK